VKIKNRGFTLLELVLVVVIIGIIAALTWPNYIAMKEHEHDREAAANLRLIMAAEKVYRMETNQYYVAVDTDAVNTNLRLALPTTANRIWTYSTEIPGAGGVCAQADRVGGDGRSISLLNSDDPNQSLADYSGACPD
jgi:prepilin-type N-terminal cleavage/methylation domain-containing protein